MTDRALQLIPGESTRTAWEEIWDKVSWRQFEVPNGDLSTGTRGNLKVNFVRIQLPWLEEATKRFVKFRLMTGTAFNSVIGYTSDIAAFSEWLAEEWPDVTSPSLLSREIVEDYIVHIRQSEMKSATKIRFLGSLRKLLEEQREDGLLGLPHSAKIHNKEVTAGSPQSYSPPKNLLSESVVRKIVDPQNLALISLSHQTMILLLAETGMRISSVLELRRDCVTHDPSGAPMLHYINVKGQREAGIPISDRLERQIKKRLEALKSEGKSGEYLFPAVGRAQAPHLSHTTLRRALKAYIAKADIRDENGNLVDHAHPHLFRHHVGTSLVNDGVPLHVVANILDHKSLDMTAHYARLQDEFIRKEMEGHFQRVNARGESVGLPVVGPEADAVWKKERISRAKQALPNGYCGRPLVDDCPHTNACLDCDSFLTDESFLPLHKAQRDQTVRLIEEHEVAGHVRLVSNLQKDLKALDRIIAGLNAIQVVPQETQSELQFDLREGLAKS